MKTMTVVSSLNFIRLLQVVITPPSVTDRESNKFRETEGVIVT